LRCAVRLIGMSLKCVMFCPLLSSPVLRVFLQRIGAAGQEIVGIETERKYSPGALRRICKISLD